MKKLGIILLLFIIPQLGFSQEQGDQGNLEHQILSLEGGMWSNPSRNRIPDSSASLIQNFYTDVETLAIERNGYEKRDSTELGDTKAVTGLWEFVDTSGDVWIISFSSRTFYKNLLGNTPTAFGLTATVDTIPDATVNLGRIWFVNGTDDLWWFDGTSTGNVSGAPIGLLVESWRERIVIGRVSSGISTLRFSEDGDGESWTLGGNPTDPFQLTIGGGNDGFPITCMWSTYIDNLIVARKRDLWAIAGFDQADVELRNINSEIGCIQSGSMREFDGSLLFMSNRGMEEMRGITISHISEPIRDITDQIVQNTAGTISSEKTTTADWSGGTFDTNIYGDTVTINGSVTSTYPDNFGSYRDGSSNTKNVWNQIEENSLASYSIGVSLGNLNVYGEAVDTGSSPNHEQPLMCVYTSEYLEDFTDGATYQFVIPAISAEVGLGGAMKGRFVLSSTTVDSCTDSFGGEYFYIQFYSTSTNLDFETNTMFIEDPVTGLTGISETLDNLDQYFLMPSTISVYIDNGNAQITVNDTIVWTATHSGSTLRRRAFFWYQGTDTLLPIGFTQGYDVDFFKVVPQTFTYTTSAYDVGTDISAWSSVTIAEDATSGVSSYEFNSSTNSDPADFDSGDWASVVSGGLPTNSVNPYAALRVAVDLSDLSDTFYLNSAEVSWVEAGIDPIVSWNHDRRYWLSYTTNTATGTNDRILVYQRNRTWTLLSGINAASFATWNDKLYFGNSDSTGYVYKFGIGNNDDGSDIDSIIVFKSYDMGFHNQEKDFRNLYLNYKSGGTGSLTMLYELDRDGIIYSLGSANMNEETGQVSAKFPFPLTNAVQGREIEYTLTKNGTGDRLKLYDLKTIFDVKEAR